MSQTSSRVGWNGGLGWWAMGQCRGFTDFALFIHSAQYAAGPLLRPMALTPLHSLFILLFCEHFKVIAIKLLRNILYFQFC